MVMSTNVSSSGLAVQDPASEGQGRFAEQLTERRMRMDQCADFGHGRASQLTAR